MSEQNEPDEPDEFVISEETITERYRDLQAATAKGGYFLHPDTGLVLDLVRGLCTNQKRYGFEACPCRFCTGTREQNLDIICPCYYRDEDLTEFGSCFCGLFVSKDVAEGTRQMPETVPERRDPAKVFPGGEIPNSTPPTGGSHGEKPYPVYRCRVCGYLCARNSPPDPCPICGAEKDRFESFFLQGSGDTGNTNTG